MARTNRQDQFLRAIHDAVNFWENTNHRERDKLLGLTTSILLILDGQHRNFKYTLLDEEGMVISGDLYKHFETADPYAPLRKAVRP